MIELIQIPYSPYCIVQRLILEFSGQRFTIHNLERGDRSPVWKLTRERYYGVPVIREGKQAIFETDHNSQVIAKYLDDKFHLGLFPAELEGLQSLLWRHLENDVEEMTFKLNDIYWKENVPPGERLIFLRHKERKFGVGCLERWREEQKSFLAELTRRLLPYDEMLIGHPFLLGDRPRFVDFDLAGMLGNFLYSGHYQLPAAHRRLRQWHKRMDGLSLHDFSSEKLRT